MEQNLNEKRKQYLFSMTASATASARIHVLSNLDEFVAAENLKAQWGTLSLSKHAVTV